MPTPTVNLTVLVVDEQAVPVSGALISCTLNRPEVYMAMVVPSTVSAVANGSGIAVIPLFPNELGAANSHYDVTIRQPTKKSFATYRAWIPNSNCNLADIATVPAFPGKPDGQIAVESAIQAAADAAADAALVLGATSRALSAQFSGGFSDIPAGEILYLPIPYGCTATRWEIVADAVGSIVVDVWLAASPTIPTVANTIAGSEKPTLTAAQQATDASLTTWTTSIPAGSILAFKVDSCSGIKRATISIKATLT